VDEVVAPWRTPLTDLQHSLIVYGLVVTALVLLAMLVRTWTVRSEVSGRYRPAIAASLGVLLIAFLAYVVMALKFDVGYDREASAWVPNSEAIWAWSTRFMDWSVTVPLLIVELLAVSSLRGTAAARTRAVGVGLAFAMVASGYLGGVAVDGGQDRTALLVWGLISSVFFAALYVLVLVTVLRSLHALPSVARPTYRGAMIVLMATWFVYPVVFGLQGATRGGAWATTGQLLICAADVVAKVAFGLLIQKVAKLRTAFDVQAGLETHPETLWINGERHSDALDPASIDPVASPRRDPVPSPNP
jgi:bacteriorhodopsin